MERVTHRAGTLRRQRRMMRLLRERWQFTDEMLRWPYYQRAMRGDQPIHDDRRFADYRQMRGTSARDLRNQCRALEE